MRQFARRVLEQWNVRGCDGLNMQLHNTGNVRINMTLSCVRVTIPTAEKQ
jgi:hypothetical protein